MSIDQILNTVFYKSSELMDELPDEVVHLVLTSPPYFNVKDYSINGFKNNSDIGGTSDYGEYLHRLKLVFAECERVLVPNGKLCVNVPLMLLPKRATSSHVREMLNIPADIYSIVKETSKLKLMDIYIWSKSNWTKRLMFGSYPYPGNLYAQNYCEFIIVFVKEGKPVARTSEQKAKSALTKEEWVLYTSQIWRVSVPSRNDLAYFKHPAIMPEEVARRIIKLYSFVGDLVLDPFAGSGTTLKVAKELGRHYVGYELYTHFRPVIESKLLAAAQNGLFDGDPVESE